MDPEECLRSLAAEALIRSRREESLLPVSAALQATANAFVMLGLLPEARAEAVLASHRSALEGKGLGRDWGVAKGELTVRPGAHRYWESRTGQPALRELPLSVVAAGTHCSTSAAEVYFDWVKLTAAGVRVSFRATSAAGQDHGAASESALEQVLSEIAVTDDGGHRYGLAAYGVVWQRGPERQEWHGQLTARHDPAGRAAWLEFATADTGPPARVILSSPAQVATGAGDPLWPTPAESYLAVLASAGEVSIDEAVLGPRDTAGIVATVADSLMAVGALPVTSRLLGETGRGESGSPGPSWRTSLISRWGRRVHQRSGGFRPAGHRGLAVRLPLQNATAVVESVSVHGDLVSVQIYGHPWVMGEYWPMITPCFRVRAVDDAGKEHDGIPAGWQGFADHDGSGGFWFWPPVDPERTSLRLTVSTLWEAAWAEVELPR